MLCIALFILAFGIGGNIERVRDRVNSPGIFQGGRGGQSVWGNTTPPGVQQLSAAVPGSEGGTWRAHTHIQVLSRRAQAAHLERLSDAGCWPFPGDECANWWAIDGCESGHGTDPDTYNPDAPNGGRMQINRSWSGRLESVFGWPWETVVVDDDVNRQAAFYIWQLAGGSWSPWSCAQIVGIL